MTLTVNQFYSKLHAFEDLATDHQLPESQDATVKDMRYIAILNFGTNRQTGRQTNAEGQI